jgi:transcriptional regulator with XRE-family HTH domain
MSATSRTRLLAKLKNKAYRDAYTAEHVKTTTPLQIRTVREQHEWTQGKLAAEAKTTQTAISRTEDPNYGNLTLNNLLKIAAALDVGLLVKLVPFSRLVKEYEDLSPRSLSTPSFMEEMSVLEAWVEGTHETKSAQPDAMNPTLILTSGAAGRYQQDSPLLELPAPGESFMMNFQSPALNFPLPRPVIIRGDTRETEQLTHEPLREVS